MALQKPKNDNYAAVVVEIKTLVPLAGCDFVQAAIIMGNQVIVGKDIKVGDIGLYFPLETQLTETYLKANNLYKKAELNADIEKKGYFEENGRIRAVKFKGHKSEGLYMPLESLSFLLIEAELNALKSELGVSFDTILSTPICNKYVSKKYNTPGTPGSKKSRSTKKYKSKLVENQFRFHQDTSMLYKNLHQIQPDDLISITYKLHGTSGISSYVLCKRHIPKREKFAAFLHNIYTNITTFGKRKFVLQETEYDYLYASRKVIKNEDINLKTEHFYDANIWEIAHNELKEFLQKGMTLYYEIVGFMPSGAAIQKDYDYGCNPGEHKIYIYRITYTNIDGKVFEFSAKQVQDWCEKNGLNAVPELFYGYASELSDERLTFEHWKEKFLETIKERYNEKDCYICKNKVPEEGAVIRIEELEFDAYKQKSNRFYERETKLLDKGEVDIEEEN